MTLLLSALMEKLHLKYNDGVPSLMPENALYSPILLIGKQAEILGVAIGVIKKN